MRRPPERILLFRSGRHLQVAIDALRRDSPGCDITVVTTAAGIAAVADAGIATDRCVVYDRTPFFQPLAFATSGAVRAAWGRYDRVCVLWSHPEGVGHANVDRTALVISPSGFTAVTPDGQLIARRTWPVLRREAARASQSCVVSGALTVLVFLPARLLRPFRT